VADVLLLTVTEAAQRIRLGRSITYDLIRRGELRSVKIGGARRVLVTDLEEFVRRLHDDSDEGAP
jgi:excisionase family DNA binding protein